MTLPWTSSGSLRAAALALVVVGCSFQNFDYLKGEYKPAAGGASGSAGAPAASGGGSGGSNLATSGAGGSAPIAGTSAGGSSGSGASGGNATGEAGAPAVLPGVLLNPGFELGSGTDVSSWLNSSAPVGAATVEFIGDAHTGSGRLGHWLMAGAYVVSTSQLVKPLPSGNYTFKIWVRHSQVLTKEYLFAKQYSHAEPGAQMMLDTVASDQAYTQIVLQHIPVTSGQCEVGIHTEGGTDYKTNWSSMDDAELTLE